MLVAGSVGPVSDEQSDFLQTIRSNAERMRTLVSDLQDITRIEADQLLLHIGDESLENLVQEVVMSFETQISYKKQTMTVGIADDLPHIRCDNTRMIQVLTNLVSNAHKYSPEGGRIEITAHEMVSTTEPEAEKPMVQVSVADNGYGISDQDQKMIFEQFFRSENNQIRESTGTGLGLSITKKLVELQGGKLWFESKLGQGTTFYFTAPTADKQERE